MSVALVVVTIAAAASNIGAAAVDFLRVQWLLDNMTKYGVPLSWTNPLGLAKAACGAGLLVGLALPGIGLAAAIGLVLYFVGAVATVVRARWYSHVPFPTVMLVLAVAALVVRLRP